MPLIAVRFSVSAAFYRAARLVPFRAGVAKDSPDAIRPADARHV